MNLKAIHYGSSPVRSMPMSGGGGLVPDHKVLSSSGDTFPDYLGNKLLAGENVSIEIQGEAGGEQKILISAESGAIPDHKVSASSTDSTPDFLNSKIAAGSNVSIVLQGAAGTDQTLEINSAGGSLSQNALLLGANVLNCSQIAGFADRILAVKISALGSGTVDKMSCYVFNTYGARKIRFGLYDYAGALISSSAETTLPAEQNKTVVLSIPPVNIISGSQYWLAVWGNGIDIPTFSSFSPYGASFPEGMHAVQNESSPTFPPVICSGYPFSITNITVPINAFN